MRISLLAILFFIIETAVAQPEIDRLIEADEAPFGVVFEIIEDDVDDLKWALPKIARMSERLRAHFPDLPIAVVTHGREQFGLLASEADSALEPIHSDAKALGDQAIDLHVCGVHASWDGYTPEDFPDYVDVAASGPALINDYVSLGYELIRVSE